VVRIRFDSGHAEHLGDRRDVPQATSWIYDIRFNEPSRAILRAHSMKSWPAGLIVRFFNVTIPTCTGRIGKSTGNAFIEKRLPLKRREDAERTAKNRPVARRAV
jgi:hypothetical protein